MPRLTTATLEPLAHRVGGPGRVVHLDLGREAYDEEIRPGGRRSIAGADELLAHEARPAGTRAHGARRGVDQDRVQGRELGARGRALARDGEPAAAGDAEKGEEREPGGRAPTRSR